MYINFGLIKVIGEKYVNNSFDGFTNGKRILFGGRTWKAFIIIILINILTKF